PAVPPPAVPPPAVPGGWHDRDATVHPMKAAVHTRYGPPEVVRRLDVDKPAISDNHVLVKVHATTVNRTDCGFRAARPFVMRFLTGLARPRAASLGAG